MRKAKLKYTTTGVVIIIVLAVILLGVLRAADIQPAEGSTEGKALFTEKGCSHCHYTEKTADKVGPGLKNLFKGETLPVSGREVNDENIRRQLNHPYDDMPSFADRLTEKETERILAYLKTL